VFAVLFQMALSSNGIGSLATSIGGLTRDVRHAARRLVRDWQFTAAAVLILAVAIGANSASFSVINAVLFRKSFFDRERLVEIYQNDRDGRPGFTSYPAFRDISEYSQLFSGVAAMGIPGPVNYRDRGAVRQAVAEFTTANYLQVLDLHLSSGRWFDASEDRAGAGLVAVVGHDAWTRKFGADPSILGRRIWINGLAATSVGVGPAGYNGTVNIGLVTELFLPVSSITALGGSPHALDRRPPEVGLFVKARLRDEVTVAQAQAAMDALGARLAKDYPDEDAGTGITVKASRDVRVHPQADGPLTALASILLIVVGLVLAIAASNLATLLLVRGTARAKEVSVRLALGASRGQIVRHLLAESLILSIAGGAIGCLLALSAIRWLGTWDLPIAVDFALDYRVLGFTVAVSIVTGMLFGLAPTLQATKVDLVSAMRADGAPRSVNRRRVTLKNALVVFQVAVSVLLLQGASVFFEMMLAARAQPVGYTVDGVAFVSTDARYSGYSASDSARLSDDLLRRIEAIPGVQSATLTSGEPMITNGMPIVVEGSADATPSIANSIWAGPRYFETLGIPILFGRALDTRDGPDSTRVAVISESMAPRYFGAIDAVGRRFRIDQDPNWMEVVGVARDSGTADLDGDLIDPTPDMFYRSPQQWNRPANTVVARTSLDASSLLSAMQRELRSIDPTLPVVAAKTMAQQIEESLYASTAIAGFLGVLGMLGVSLAAVGLYAVISYAVTRRAREIGIRMALGAQSRQVVWTVARDVAVVVSAGTALGILLSVPITLLLRAFFTPTEGVVLYRPGMDPLAIVAIASIVTIVAAAAAYFPARRAASMDPLTALRRE
jgi:predicted permease